MTTNKTISVTFVSTATEIVIDNTDPGWTNTSPSGSWTSGAAAGVPKIGTNYLYTAGTGGSSITRSCRWTPDIGIAGFYDVYVYYQIGANRTVGATYKVFYNGGNVSSLQNQYSTTPNQGGWFLVGAGLPFAAGTAGYVELGNNTPDTLYVSADAAKFIYVAPITPPAITLQPQGLTVNQGSDATFTVLATGTAPLAYQWYFGSLPIEGATGSQFVVTNAQPAAQGDYSVEVLNVAGQITSSDAVLIVTQPVPPQIDWITILSDGQIQLQASGLPGHYAVEVTTNLVNRATWAELTNFSTTNTTFQYLDSETNLTQRFYRIRLVR
jgi:hypothetical protein